MGQGTSRHYPAESDLSSGEYTFTSDPPPLIVDGAPGSISSAKQNLFGNKKKQVINVFKKMESNLKMYMLYDNYDSKNEVILLDLKKKAKNQEEELKLILESRDKLMAEFQSKRDDTDEYKSKDYTTEVINTILFLVLLGTIIFIIYKLYTYPTDEKNNNGVNINNLLDLESADLNNLSEEDLNSLEKAFDAKINNLENNINVNSSNKSNNSSKNSLNNSIKNNSSSNSVNNITNTNIKKRNKLTLN
jgi:hypothetical protein